METKKVTGGFGRPTVVWARVTPGLVLAVKGPECTHIDDQRVSQTIGVGPDSGAFRYPSEFDTREDALCRALKAEGISPSAVELKWVYADEMARAVPSYRWEE